MARYPLNQPITLSTTVRDKTSALVDAGALTLLVKVRAADGTLTTTGTYASPAHDGLGAYHQDIPVADLQVLGRYQYTWTATGTGAGVSLGDFDVFDPFEGVLFSLQDAKDHINFRGGTDSDQELYRFMRAAAELIEAKAGVCRPRTFTHEVDAPEGTIGLLVPRQPVLSVQSVTSLQTGGPSWTTAQLRADEAGIIFQTAQGAGFWGAPWNVAYTAGRADIPERLVHAGKEQLRHLWDTQRGSMPPSLLSGEEVFTASAGGFSFSVPRRVLELLADEMMPSI